MSKLNIEQYRELEESYHKELHNNLVLLSVKYATTNDFGSLLRQGMFAKSNPAGLLHVMHFLLNIIDPVGFKNNFQWPLYDKRMESNFKTVLRTYLSGLNIKFPFANIPTIRASHMVTPGGFQFTKIVLKISELAFVVDLQKSKNVYFPDVNKVQNQRSVNNFSDDDKNMLLVLTEKIIKNTEGYITCRDKFYQTADNKADLLYKTIMWVDSKTSEKQLKIKNYLLNHNIPGFSEVQRQMIIDDPKGAILNIKSDISLRLKKMESKFKELTDCAALYKKINNDAEIFIARSEKDYSLDYKDELKNFTSLRKFVAETDIPLVEKIVENGILHFPFLLHCLSSVINEIQPFVFQTTKYNVIINRMEKNNMRLSQNLEIFQKLNAQVCETKLEVEKSLNEARKNFEISFRNDDTNSRMITSLTTFWPAISPYRNLNLFKARELASPLLCHNRAVSMIDLNNISNNSSRNFPNKPSWVNSNLLMTIRKPKRKPLEKSAQKYQSSPCLAIPDCKTNLALIFNSSEDISQVSPNTPSNSLYKIDSKEELMPKSITLQNKSPVNRQDKYRTPPRTSARRSITESNLKLVEKRLSYIADEMPVLNLSTFNSNSIGNSPNLLHPTCYKTPGDVSVCKLISLNNTEANEEMDAFTSFSNTKEIPYAPSTKNTRRISKRFSLGPLLSGCTESLLDISGPLNFNESIDE